MMFFILFFLFLVEFSKSDTVPHEKKEEIPLIAEKMWPTANPSETYSFYLLPFCDPKKKVGQSLGAELSGSSSYETAYVFKFGVDLDHELLCQKDFTKKQLKKLRNGVKKNFYVLMSFDDLPLKFPIGKTYETPSKDRVYKLFTHIDYHIWINDGYVVEVEAVPSDQHMIDLTKTHSNVDEVKFTYSVHWVQTTKPAHLRWEKYVSFKLFPEEIEIQWFSIMNSLILVIVLTSFVAFIMSRILSRDYAYYDEEDGSGEETGWKQIHGEVFRFPKHVNLLCALLGNGVQLTTSILAVLLLSVLGVYYPGYSNRTLYSSLLVVWVLSTGISGYVSAKYYKQFGGERWVRNVVLTVFLFVGPCFLTWCILNTIALSYRSSAAFSFKLVAGLLLFYCLISFPLQLIGAITAKNFSGEFDAPCRVKLSIREIPPIPWYKTGLVQITVSGFLPFSAIYIELYYFYLSIWGHIFFTPYIVLLIFFLILLLVTSCITIAMIYIQISHEDHHWWWRSFLCGGAGSFFIFGYSVFYYYFESPMEGFFQFAYYFGLNLVICYGFFLMLSAIGFFSSLVFMKRIYRGIRVD